MLNSAFYISLILALAVVAVDKTDAQPPASSASDLLVRVRKNMPLEPLDLSARIRTFNRQGNLRNEQQMDLRLRLGQSPAKAGYTLRSIFDDFIQEVRIHFQPETGIPEMWQKTEDGGEEKAVTNSYIPIEKTELNWLDISFGFLWWPGGTIKGVEAKLGRDAVVVDLSCPDANAPYSGVRLWIDPEIDAVLEIEVHGNHGRRLKRLRVKRLRKRDDKWFLKELEVLNVQTFRRTQIVLED